MPWAWHMAQWCYDPTESHLAGVPRFKRPYPQKNWLDDKRWNEPLIEAMELIHKAVRVFSKPGNEWKKEENEFYLWMEKGLI